MTRLADQLIDQYLEAKEDDLVKMVNRVFGGSFKPSWKDGDGGWKIGSVTVDNTERAQEFADIINQNAKKKIATAKGRNISIWIMK